MDRQSCIVTGGAGFIGTHLLSSLNQTKRFNRIFVLDSKPPQVDFPGVVHIPCDLKQPLAVDISEPCHTCFHLAAVCKEPGYEWEEYFSVNYAGTVNLRDFAERIGIRNIIFTSTMMVYRAGEQRCTEDALTAPDTAYGMSKLLAELVLKEWGARSPQRRLRIVRPGVVFGKGESANYTRLYHALRKKRFVYVGRKSTVKGSIYVKDLVRFLEFLTDDPLGDSLYNLVYPEPLTIEDICTAMCEVFGFNSHIPVLPYRLALLGGYVGEFLSQMGINTHIHHRRIEKLYNSTDLTADRACKNGFRVAYPLRDALRDWQKDCLPEDIY